MLGNRRKWLAAGTAAVLASVMAGCSGGAGEKPATTAAAAGQSTVLRAAVGDIGAGYEYVYKMARMFEAENPGTKVEVSQAPPTNDKLLELMKSDHSPDIVELNANSFFDSIRQGAAMDLTPFFKKDSIDLNQYYKGALEAVTLDNKIAALPFDVHTMGVYYSKKRFDEQKLPYPKDGWTWDEFVDTAKRLNSVDAQGNVKAAVHYFHDVEMVEALVFANKGSYLGPDGQSDGYVNSPRTAEAVRLYADLFRTLHVASPVNQGDSIQALTRGQAAMAFEFSYRASQIVESPDIGVVGLPSLPKAGHGNVLYVQGLGISAKSKNKEEAWKFLSYVGMPKGDGAALWGSRQLAVTKSVADASGQSKHPVWSVFLKELEYAKRGAFYDNETWNGLRESHNNDIRDLISGDGDVLAMLEKWRVEYDTKKPRDTK